eukprot:3783218-Alexandrium_andersonii.AAC.1
MAQSCNGWHEDTAAAAAVMTSLATWTNSDIDVFLQSLAEYDRPLRPRIAHAACCPHRCPFDIHSMHAAGPPGQFFHFLCYQHWGSFPIIPRYDP